MDAPAVVGREHDRFAVAVLRAVTWRAILAAQGLALLFAVTPWLRQPQPTWQSLVANLLRQIVAAQIVVLAAFAGDEAVRRGMRVWHAFVVAVLGASIANVLVQALLARAFDLVGSAPGLLGVLENFLILGAAWATAIMVFLNRRAAQRLLMRLRAGELERAQAELRLTASRLAAAEAQIDSSALLRQLAEVRNLYDVGRPEAEPRFEALITGLREALARGADDPTRDTSS